MDARLKNGAEVYPHRTDLHNLPFWKCDTCGNFVGCHYKSAEPTKPLGCIATPEIKKARIEVHALIDPLWKSGAFKRNKLYGLISEQLGWKYHTANIRSLEEANKVIKIAKTISEERRNSGVTTC